jgi:hypothetical protein
MHIRIGMLSARQMSESESCCASVRIGQLTATIEYHERRIIQMLLKLGH